MFNYCLNNPLVYVDICGYVPSNLIDVVPACYGQAEILASSNPKDSPPNHPDFVPPKKGNQKQRNPNGQGWGWVDNKGNVWVWTPRMHGGEGWTVQEPGGGHSHAYPGGTRRTHAVGISAQGILLDFPSIHLSPNASCFPFVSTAIVFCVAICMACDTFMETYLGQ